jgi:hypothetical protein
MYGHLSEQSSREPLSTLYPRIEKVCNLPARLQYLSRDSSVRSYSTGKLLLLKGSWTYATTTNKQATPISCPTASRVKIQISSPWYLLP